MSPTTPHVSADDLRAKVAADYDTIADEWDRTRRRSWGEFTFLSELIKRRGVHELTKRADKRVRILDAGCGNGRLVNFLDLELAGMYGYLGVDASGELIKKAQAQYPDVSFLQQDLVEFRRDQEFDVIASIAVVHHLPAADRLTVLWNLRSSLSPNGQLFLTCWNLWQPRYLSYVAKSYFAGTPRECRIPFADTVERYVHAFTAGEIADLLTAAGFTDIDVFYTDGAHKSTIVSGKNIVAIARGA